jgi:hypothetical protein
MKRTLNDSKNPQARSLNNLRKLFAIGLAVGTLALNPNSASGAVIFSTYDGSDVSGNGGLYVNREHSSFWSGQEVAVPFTTHANSYTLDSAELNLTYYSGNSDSFRLSLYTDDGGVPGVRLGSLSNPETIASAGNFTFGGAGLTLSASTTYWMVADVDLSAQSRFTWNSVRSVSTFSYAGLETTAGASWGPWSRRGVGTGPEPALIINATVPEPGAAALIGLGGICLAWRLRKTRSWQD